MIWQRFNDRAGRETVILSVKLKIMSQSPGKPHIDLEVIHGEIESVRGHPERRLQYYCSITTSIPQVIP